MAERLARLVTDKTLLLLKSAIAISTGRNSDKMGLREFLSIPKLRRRKKSKARSEIGPIEGPSTVDLPELRLTGSTPDLRIGSSASAAQNPLTSPGQELKGTKPDSSRMIHLRTLLQEPEGGIRTRSPPRPTWNNATSCRPNRVPWSQLRLSGSILRLFRPRTRQPFTPGDFKVSE